MQTISLTPEKPQFRGAESNTNDSKQNGNSENNKYVHNPAGIKRRRGSCYHCNGTHQLFTCTSFERMSNELQYERLRNLGICVKCLRRGHTADTCRMKSCECGGAHNKLLCDKRNTKVTALSITHPAPLIREISASLLATLSVFAYDEHGNKVKCRAVSDGGSHMNMVTNRLVQRLKPKISNLAVLLEGPGRKNIAIKSVVDIKISPADNGSSCGEWLRAGVLPIISDKLPS